MKKLNLIKVFKFKQAAYEVADGSGVSGVLKLDYKNNNFLIALANDILSEDTTSFKKELVEVAEDLLARKHGVNFADTGNL